MQLFAVAALAVGASATVLRRGDKCTFGITVSGGAHGRLGQLDDGQNRVGPQAGSGAQYTISNGAITDAHNRGCILTPPTTQFQCDVGATPTPGFSISGNGQILSNGSGVFYACPADDNGNYNIYTTPVANQAKCVQVSLSTTNGACIPKPSAIVTYKTSSKLPKTTFIYRNTTTPAVPKTSLVTTTKIESPPTQTVYITKTETPTTKTVYITKSEEKTLPGKTITVTATPQAPQCPAASTVTVQKTVEQPVPVVSTKVEQKTVQVPVVSTQVEQKTVQVPVVSTKVEQSTVQVPVVSTKVEQSTVHVPVPVVSTKVEQSTVQVPVVSTKVEATTVEKPVPVVSTKVEQSTVQVPVVSTKVEQSTVAVPTTVEKPVPVVSTKVEQSTVAVPTTVEKPIPVVSTKVEQSTVAVPTTVEKPIPVVSTKVEQSTVAVPTTVQVPVVSTKVEQTTVKQPYPVVSTVIESTTIEKPQPPVYKTSILTSIEQPKPTTVPVYVSVPAPSSYAPPAPSKSATPTPSQPKPASSCPADLTGDYLRPRLITPVDSTAPNQAGGTKYNATISSTVSTIFTFDIPPSYTGKTYVLEFLFPRQDQLETSAFTLSGSGDLIFEQLSTAATEQTSFSSAGTGQKLSTVGPSPGTAYTIQTASGNVGKSISYKVSATGNLALEFFQDYNPCPIGVFIQPQ